MGNVESDMRCSPATGACSDCKTDCEVECPRETRQAYDMPMVAPVRYERPCGFFQTEQDDDATSTEIPALASPERCIPFYGEGELGAAVATARARGDEHHIFLSVPPPNEFGASRPRSFDSSRHSRHSHHSEAAVQAFVVAAATPCEDSEGAWCEASSGGSTRWQPPSSASSIGSRNRPLPRGEAVRLSSKGITAASPNASRPRAEARISGGTGGTATPEAELARRSVEQFVSNIIKGLELEVLTDASKPDNVVVSMDRALQYLHLQRVTPAGDVMEHTLGLERVVEVIVGDDVGASEVELPLDPRCVTLLLDDFQALAFRFERDNDRDMFAVCLAMFVDGRREKLRLPKKPATKEQGI